MGYAVVDPKRRPRGSADEDKVKTTPIQFFREVRQEVSKVTWPSRKEVIVTTAMVLAMVVVIAIFFLIVDQILAFGIKTILGIGG
jgi:preprotein translocase subunit SecE